ncbi:MAG: radical SAM protein [Phascolarctobacterium sp.]|nr:radical SAM protein [Phascolarctobacterium sp.]
MFYSLKKDCYFRKYGNIGYIVHSIYFIGEVVNESGTLFIEQLDYSLKSIDEIVKKLLFVFDDVDERNLKNDIIEFYEYLYSVGYLNRCSNPNNFTEEIKDVSTITNEPITKDVDVITNKTISEFFADYAKNNPFLVTFHVELTSKCNERCVHCYIPHETKNNEIDYDLLVDIIAQCRDMGVMNIVLSGGEPMLYPYFSDVLKKIKDYDMNVVVLSNLTLLDDKIIQTLQYKHTTCVNVSLYSMEAGIHESITMLKGSFEKTKNNILKLIDNNIPVRINCPIMKQNKDNFVEVMRWGYQHKCSVKVDYLMMAKKDGTLDNLSNRLSSQELRNVMKNIINNDEDLQCKIRNGNKKISKPVCLDTQALCGVGLTTLSMDSQGNIYPCVGWQKCNCGNVKETALKDIWEHSKELNYLRKLRFGDFVECRNCEDVHYCAMCLSMNANESKDGDVFDIPKITCEAAKIYHKVIEEYYKKIENK